MADVCVSGLIKKYGAFTALRGIDLVIADGEFIVFVGPSGSGKSTLLRCIAGLEPIQGGSVVIDDEDVTDVDPADRDLSMVFQNYALFPHMTCRANLEFPLRTAREDKAQIDRRVSDAGRLLHIEELLDRKPAELSGGQRQRVAIGRAIVKEPKVFLFDEPLSNLDAELRIRMRVEIVKLHRQLRNTIIYVTHDQVEAMTMADRIVVLRDGRIEQIGTPHDLYYRPANRFIATFIGAPPMNILPCRALTAGATETTIAYGSEATAILPIGPVPEDAMGELLLGFRTEHISFSQPEHTALELRLVVDFIEHLGAMSNIYGVVTLSDDKQVDIIASTGREVRFKEGTEVPIWIDADQCYLFSADGTAVSRRVVPPQWK